MSNEDHSTSRTPCETGAREHCLSDDDARKIAAAVVDQTFLKLGADPSKPLDLQADFRFLRSWRTTHEKVSTKVLLTLVTFVLGAIVTLIVAGFLAYVRRG